MQAQVEAAVGELRAIRCRLGWGCGVAAVVLKVEMDGEGARLITLLCCWSYYLGRLECMTLCEFRMPRDCREAEQSDTLTMKKL